MNQIQSGTLYIVATPIGNLSDMTAHAIDCLKSVDIIACEDTRTSGKLLNHFNITTKTIAYHDHNAEAQTAKLVGATDETHPSRVARYVAKYLTKHEGGSRVRASAAYGHAPRLALT